MSFSEEVLEEARMRYDAERFYYITPSLEERERINAEACSAVASQMGLDPEELAKALGAPRSREGGET